MSLADVLFPSNHTSFLRIDENEIRVKALFNTALRFKSVNLCWRACCTFKDLCESQDSPIHQGKT